MPRWKTGFLPLLDMLFNNDTSFYGDDCLVIHFFHYVSMQHMRTKGIKTQILASWNPAMGVDVARNVGYHQFYVRRKYWCGSIRRATGS